MSAPIQDLQKTQTQNTQKLGFFTPIAYNEIDGLGQKENYSFLRFTENYLTLSGRRVKIVEKQTGFIGKGNTFICQDTFQNHSNFLVTTLKVISYATIILPLLALIGKAIYRSSNDFCYHDVTAKKLAAAQKSLNELKKNENNFYEWLKTNFDGSNEKIKNLPDNYKILLDSYNLLTKDINKMINHDSNNHKAWELKLNVLYSLHDLQSIVIKEINDKKNNTGIEFKVSPPSLDDIKKNISETLDEALKSNPNNINILFMVAKHMYKDRPINSNLILHKIILLDPQNVDALKAMAYISSELNQFEGCLTSLDKLIEIEPNNLKHKLEKTEYLIKLGEIDKALNFIDPVIKQPLTTNEDSILNYTWQFMSMINQIIKSEKYEKALEIMGKIKINNKHLEEFDPHYMYKKIYLLCKLKQFDLALKINSDISSILRLINSWNKNNNENNLSANEINELIEYYNSLNQRENASNN